jgi:hypothetical protein
MVANKHEVILLIARNMGYRIAWSHVCGGQTAAKIIFFKKGVIGFWLDGGAGIRVKIPATKNR